MSKAETISLHVVAWVWWRGTGPLACQGFYPGDAANPGEIHGACCRCRLGWVLGCTSRSGELQRAVVTFAGKVSAGVGIRTVKGRDLVLPKAVTHTFGRKKFTSRRPCNKCGDCSVALPGAISQRGSLPQTVCRHRHCEVQSMIVEYINDRLGHAEAIKARLETDVPLLAMVLHIQDAGTEDKPATLPVAYVIAEENHLWPGWR